MPHPVFSAESSSWLGSIELSRMGIGLGTQILATHHIGIQRQRRVLLLVMDWCPPSQLGTVSRSTDQLFSTHIWPRHEPTVAPGLGLCQNPDVRASLSNRAPGFWGHRSMGSGVPLTSSWAYIPHRAPVRCPRPILPLQCQGTVTPTIFSVLQYFYYPSIIGTNIHLGKSDKNVLTLFF